MTRFVVEEGGKRRAFKVGNGVITVGSGPHATLKLASESVAELHAELDVHDGVVKLKPKAGVLPPKLAGRAVTSETIVPRAVVLTIGDAKITVDPPEHSATDGKAKPKEKEAWQRSNRELYKQSGLTPAQWLLILGPIAVIAFFVLQNYIGQAPAPAITADVQILAAREKLKSAAWDQAEADLRSIPERNTLDQATLAEIVRLEGEIANGRKESERAARNLLGTEFWQAQLVNFEQTRLASKIEKPAVRLFLKRLTEFEQTWPDHEQMEWVRRKRERYIDMVDFAKPASFEDIDFEIDFYRRSGRRNYKEAFAVLESWLKSAIGDERARGLELLDKLTKERDEWFVDRLQQAAFEFKRNQLGQSLEWLAVIIVYSGDPKMAERAGEELVKFHGLEIGPERAVVDLRERMRGYRRTPPHYWEAFMKVPAIKEWVAANPLD